MTKLLYKVSTPAFLAITLVIALLPFLDLRVLRMAGDEKVYVSTAIEMARNGTWFVQTLADEPNYFKGPLHYLFMRVGMIVFGDRLIAGTWMNLALALGAALAMYGLGRRRWGDKSGLLLGLATGLNVGVFSHALASQMEVELLAFYGFAVAALGFAAASDRKPSYKSDVFFWLAAGVAGWIKSPVHSALIGVGGLLFWLLNGELTARLRRPACWLALLTGITAGAAGYLPALVFDYQNFYATYVLREQFEKANNQRSWDYVMKPLLHFLLPWTFVVLGALIRLFKPAAKRSDTVMLKLGLSMALPTLLFWTTWTYKGQNYNLPAIPAILLLGWAAFDGVPPRWALRASAALGLITALLAATLAAHFWPLPDWWGLSCTILAIAALVLFSAIYLFSDDVRVLGAGAAAFFIAFGAFVTPFGEREMLDARRFIRAHPDATLHYYNLDPSIWSEWGLLQLTLHRPIHGLHKPSHLARAVKPGHAIIVQDNQALGVVMAYWKQHPTSHEPVVTPWLRWLTKGKSSDGRTRWRVAWENRDLHELEREFYIVYFP